MPDPIHDRLRPLREIRAPDLWDEAERRASAAPAPLELHAPPTGRRLLQVAAAAAALAVVVGGVVLDRDGDGAATIDAADQGRTVGEGEGPPAALVEPVVACPTGTVDPASLPRGVVVKSFKGHPGLGGSTGMRFEWQQEGRRVHLEIYSPGNRDEYVPPDDAEELQEPPRHLLAPPFAVVQGPTGRPPRCERYRLRVTGEDDLARELVVAISARLRFIDPADVPPYDPDSKPLAVFLSPEGPYTDGQEVTVSVPRGLAADWSNDGPRLCSTVDGADSCDPTWSSGGYDGIGAGDSGLTRKLVLRRWVFTPDGWQDCAKESVACHFLVPQEDGGFAASNRIRFERREAPGPIPVDVEPSLIAGSVRATVAAPVQPDPSWADFAREHPARADGYPPFRFSVCVFVDRGHDCGFVYDETLEASPAGIRGEIRLARELFGFGGWHDCAVESCFVLVHARRVVSISAESLVGDDRAVAAAPFRADPDIAAPPRPTITILEQPPYEHDQQVTVRIDHIPAAGGYELAICHQDPQVLNDCGYGNVEVLAPSFEATIDLFRGYQPDECAAGRCYLALMPAQEGAGPVTTLPLTFLSASG